jgi:hypothetical protein
MSAPILRTVGVEANYSTVLVSPLDVKSIHAVIKVRCRAHFIQRDEGRLIHA